MGLFERGNVMISQGDGGGKPALLGDGTGIALPLSCPQCSTEARIDLQWPEVVGLSQGQMFPPTPGVWIDKTTTGYVIGRVCEVCARHYAKQGIPYQPTQGMRGDERKAAILRRREVSASRPVGLEMILRWIAQAKSRGLL